MYQFTIKDIENLCDIKAHTLRIWEQRHSLLVPKRKQSNHRLYDNEDLKKLLRISVLYHQGWKISKIAQLSSTALLNEIGQLNPGAESVQYHIAKLIEKAIDFDKEAFISSLNDII